jgi:hypothetical protein
MEYSRFPQDEKQDLLLEIRYYLSDKKNKLIKIHERTKKKVRKSDPSNLYIGNQAGIANF